MTADSELDRYKLETTLDGDDIIHVIRRSELSTWQPGIEIKERWRQKKKIGSRAFGVVWSQQDQKGGQVRAVKSLSRNGDNSRELATLAKLVDVSAPE